MENKTDHRTKQLKRVKQRDEQQKMSALLVTKKSLGIFSSKDLVSEIEKEIKTDQRRAKQRSAEQRLPSFLSAI